MAVKKNVADAGGIGPRFPNATHARSTAQGILPLLPRYNTVSDAFEGLPEPVYEPKDTALSYPGPSVSGLESYYRAKSGVVHNHVARKLNPKQVERIRAVGMGRMRILMSL